MTVWQCSLVRPLVNLSHPLLARQALDPLSRYPKVILKSHANQQHTGTCFAALFFVTCWLLRLKPHPLIWAFSVQDLAIHNGAGLPKSAYPVALYARCSASWRPHRKEWNIGLGTWRQELAC